MLTRSVLTHEEGGAKCLPLRWHQWCMENPCPVDCSMGEWTKWSKCSADCGGGTQQRLRDVLIPMRHEGKTCAPAVSERQCNTEACDPVCQLTKWSKWSKCSKHCDGGTQKRQKDVKKESAGQSNCPSKWSLERLEYQKCNVKACELPDPTKALPCESSMDVVLLIDGSGSLGKAGWDAEIKAADTFVQAFVDGTVIEGGSAKDAKAHIALILFSGPRTWSGVWKCTGESDKKIDMKEDCNIDVVDHFTGDLEKVRADIAKLVWPGGSTLTSVAIMLAKAELQLGRKDSTSAVVIITDGRPLSFRKTEQSSFTIRKETRLVWVPVTRNIPLKNVKKWATRLWEENVISVNTFAELARPDPMSKVIADICPEPFGYDHWR